MSVKYLLFKHSNQNTNNCENSNNYNYSNPNSCSSKWSTCKMLGKCTF